MKKILCAPLLVALMLPLAGASSASGVAVRKPTLQASVTVAKAGTPVVLKGKVYAKPHKRVKLQKKVNKTWTIVDRTRTGKNKRYRFKPVLQEGTNTYRVIVNKTLRSRPVTVRGKKNPQSPAVVPTAATASDLCEPASGTNDIISVPADANFTYTVDGRTVTSGPFSATGTAHTVRAAAKPGTVLKKGATTQWTFNFTKTACDVVTPPSTGWPDASNTGVPAGTVLTPYTGPCTITSARTITGQDVLSKCNAILIQTKGVIIEKSLLPRVDSTYQDGGSSVTITDSTVRAGQTSIGAVWGYNFNVARLNITGGQHSVHCNDNCVVTDSWLHDQWNPDGGAYHNNAFISNGGSNMTIRHNTLHCTAILNATDGGCTADLSLFGDFGPIDNVLVENNLFKSNNSSISYCAYGGDEQSKPHQATNVRFVNNVFERGANGKCGVYGPVTSFDSQASGNVWTGNVWSDGTILNP